MRSCNSLVQVFSQNTKHSLTETRPHISDVGDPEGLGGHPDGSFDLQALGESTRFQVSTYFLQAFDIPTVG